MKYVLIFIIGGILGFTAAAIMSSSGYADKMQEAYDIGYKAGLKNKSE